MSRGWTCFWERVVSLQPAAPGVLVQNSHELNKWAWLCGGGLSLQTHGGLDWARRAGSELGCLDSHASSGHFLSPSSQVNCWSSYNPEGLKRMKRRRTDKCTLSALSGDLHLLLPSDIRAPSPAFRLRQGFTPSAPWSSGLQPPTESHHLLSRVSSLQMADLSAIII